MAGLIESLVGHDKQKNWLLSQWQLGHLPSSLIFQGPSGIGKKYLAKSLLQTINCDQSEGACGTCSNCNRALEDKNEMVFNLELESKKNISVDQIREVHSFLNLKALKNARFVIIDPADRLSVSAANSLLKVLEEAPEKTYFILVTDRMRSLLPTIRSRSHTLDFNSLSRQELLKFKPFEPLALNWSDGRLQMALEFEDPKKVDQLNDSLQFLYQLMSGQPQDWKRLAPWFFADEISRQFNFNIWKQALSKRLHQQGENLDWLPEESGKIALVYETLENLKMDIKSNVDKVLAIENFFYRLKGLELY